MSTRWESVVALAQELDSECALGSAVDPMKVARLARAVLQFQHDLVRGTRHASAGLPCDVSAEPKRDT